MSFARPILLLLLVLPILLGFWLWNRRGQPLVLPFDHGTQTTGHITRRIVSIFDLAPAFLLAVAIAILAGPQQPGAPRDEREMVNIQLLLDVSGSMRSPFGDGTRYDAAMHAIHEFTSYRKGDAFGLTIFGNEVLHWVPLTRDLDALRRATPFLRPERLPRWFGGTQIGKAVLAAMDLLVREEEGDRMIILLSDGQSSDLGNGADVDVAARLRDARIVLYAIHVGNSVAPEQFRTLAEASGGQVFATDDPSALSLVFRHIDQMEKAMIKRRVSTLEDCFFPFALLGLGLLGLQLVALLGMRYTPW